MVDRLERVQFVLEHHDHQGAVLGIALHLHRDYGIADGAGTALEGARCWDSDCRDPANEVLVGDRRQGRDDAHGLDLADHTQLRSRPSSP